MIQSSDFPVYEAILQTDNLGKHIAKKDFESAQNGDIDKEVSFALGIQTVAICSFIPNVTEEMRQKTLKSCLAIFDRASDKNECAKIMAEDFRKRGLGTT